MKKSIEIYSLLWLVLITFFFSPHLLSQPLKVFEYAFGRNSYSWYNTIQSLDSSNYVITGSTGKNTYSNSSFIEKMKDSTLILHDSLSSKTGITYIEKSPDGFGVIFSKEGISNGKCFNSYDNNWNLVSSVGIASALGINGNVNTIVVKQIYFFCKNYYISGYYDEVNQRFGFILCISSNGNMLNKYITSNLEIYVGAPNSFKTFFQKDGIYFIVNTKDSFYLMNFKNDLTFKTKIPLKLKNKIQQYFFSFLGLDSKIRLMMVDNSELNSRVYLCEVNNGISSDVSELILPISGIISFKEIINDTFICLFQYSPEGGVGVEMLTLNIDSFKTIWKYQVTNNNIYYPLSFDFFDKYIYILCSSYSPILDTVYYSISKLYAPNFPEYQSYPLNLKDVNLRNFKFNIYPNPLFPGNNLNIDVQSGFDCQIFDSRGNAVLDKNFFIPGIYFVKVVAPSGASVIKKLVVQ